MVRFSPAVLAASALVLAGCLEQAAPGVEDTVRQIPVLANPLLLDHDHKDPKLHADLATPNFHALSHMKWDAILLDRYPVQQYGEADVAGHYAFVAALVSGFAIVDVADPAAPKTASFTLVPPGYVADIKSAEGGDLALLGMQSGVRLGLRAAGVPVPQAPVPVPIVDGLRGIQAWDTSDKAHPILAGYVFVDRGCHMLSVLEQSGATYVYCAPNDDTVQIFKLLHQGPLVVFQPVATWSPEDLVGQVQYKQAPVGGQFTHDMTVQKDPLTGDPIMFVSFWDRGVFLVDVKDPAAPKTLSVWNGEGATLYDGNLHTSMATAIGGKRILVTIPEYAKTPSVSILDATDLAHPTLLSEWQASPEDGYGENPSIFSTHNFQLVGGKIYLAMYHGGVWVLDIADPARPYALGYALPNGEPGLGFGLIGSIIPDTWDVVVANGYVFAVDIATGFYAYAFEGDPLGDAAYDSFA